MVKIIPKCLNGKEVAFINSGFFVPCCNIDLSRIEDFREYGIFEDKFYIDNIEDPLSEVFHSAEWQRIYDVVTNHPEQAPNTCKRWCGEGFKDKEENRINIKQL